MGKVFVIDTNLKPCNPVHAGRARTLLNQGKAAVYRHYPFTIILKTTTTSEPEPLRVKIDSGSKVTGLAVVNDNSGEVVWAAELTHRGLQIKKSLESRKLVRRRRRNKNLRYRRPKFKRFVGLHKNDKRRKLGRPTRKDTLAPSLMSRVYNVRTWVARLCRLAPIQAISVEVAKFDTQKLENPDVAGVEYQRGTLYDYEVWEYLLERDNHTCQYCGVKDTPFERDHVVCKARGGSDRISNLVVACHKCNQRKGTQPVEEFLKDKPAVLKKIQAQLKKPLRDAAVMNSTRYKLLEALKEFGLPVEAGTGSRTKFNRVSQGLPKTHWLDAACVGTSTPNLIIKGVVPLRIKAKGRGSRQMCLTDKYGFPKSHRKHNKVKFGFQTGDIVKAVVPKGKFQGNYVGRITIRDRPSFVIRTLKVSFDVHPKYLRGLQKSDGYDYN